MTTGDVTLTDFELSASPYGITGKGAGKAGSGPASPVNALALTCGNCLRLIDDMAAYEMRLQQKCSCASSAEKAASLAIDPRLVEGFKGFLSALVRAAERSSADKTDFTRVPSRAAIPALR